MNSPKVLFAPIACLIVTGCAGGMSPGRECSFAPLYRTPKPPSMDAGAEDACWRDAVVLAPFSRINAPHTALATRQSAMTACWDDEFLYVRVICEETDLKGLKAEKRERDTTNLWEDDCVELFIQPRPDERLYYHVIVNAHGSVYDEVCRYGKEEDKDTSWHSDAKVCTAIDEANDYWSVIAALPWDSLGGRPELDKEWRLNVCREQVSLKEWSAWSPTLRTFHEPDSFGTVVLRERGPAVELQNIEQPFLGRNRWRIELRNAEPDADYVAEILAWTNGKRRVAASKELRGDAQSVGLEWTLSDEVDGKVACRVVDNVADGVVFAGPPVAFHVEQLGKRLRECAARAEKVTAALSSAGASEEHVGQCRDCLLKLEEHVSRIEAAHSAAAEENVRLWGETAPEVERLELEVSRLELRSAWMQAGTGGGHGDFALDSETSLLKVLPERPYRGALGRPLEILACGNEVETGQLLIITFDRPLHGVTVACTDLEGPDGAMLSAKNVELYVVGYVRTHQPAYEVDFVGLYPDVLEPNRPFEVPCNFLQSVWVSVRVPAGTPGGRYSGKLWVRPEKSAPASLELTVTVAGFSLPKTTTLKTAFALFEQQIAAWYGMKTPLPRDVRRRFYSFLLDRRINPTNIYSGSPVPCKEDLDFCLERGMNAFNVKHVPRGVNWDEKTRRTTLDFYRDYYAFLKEKGILDKAYTYCFDESPPDYYDVLNSIFDEVKQVAPDLPRATTSPPSERLFGHVDIYVPLTAAYKEEACRERQKKGDEIWWYVCCGPHHPYANWFIDYPSVDHRILFWMTFKQDVTGFLYYALNMWGSNHATKGLPGYLRPHPDEMARKAIDAGRRFPEVPWNTFTYSNFNGDGHLIYPGPNATPWSSVRLENIRDGIEDHEALCLLRSLARFKDRLSHPRVVKAFDLGAPLISSLEEYAQDPKVLLRKRAEVYATIEWLMKEE